MADMSVTLDFTPLIKALEDVNGIKGQINTSVEKLAMAAFQQTKAFVDQKIKTEYDHKLFIDHLKFQKNSTGGLDAYVIILEEPALSVEDGHGDIHMKDTHLKNKKYIRIPFDHSKRAKRSGPGSKGEQIMNEIKTALKSAKVPLSKPIVDNTGNPILSTKDNPRAAAMIKKVESQFKGSVSGKSILNNLNVYQTERINSRGKTTIDRTYMTFRTLSKNSKAKWIIPGKAGVNIFDEVYKWIETNYKKFLDEQFQNINLITS